MSEEVVRLKNYKECSLEDFNRALDFVHKGVPPRVAPDDLLYIIYTKYREDAGVLSMQINSSYASGLFISSRRIYVSALQELKRRGYNSEGVKVS